MQKSMDKMVSKIKSLEKKVSGSSSKKKKATMAPTFPRSRSLLTTPRRLPAQEPHRASSFEPREGETTRRGGGRVPKADAPTRPLDSIESKQRKLNSIELMVESALRNQIREPWVQVRSDTLPGVPSEQMEPLWLV
ncbi:unnamed protein product [Microthlaspi erraticum]|uniref:Uncharacterized protein n=1 Tax=Microthlaspi erraticum TaxID=1685480 RepID=A0A6D2K716_9BRAS|nr:unnamed protein product [Microthlaspi erraticum]